MERNRRGRPRHPDVLTPAEWRVLDALRDGGTNADIAARLGLSADTVKYHISNMLAKLELRDRRALASWRPEERRGRLGALSFVPAVVWSVARPIAWVGAGTAAVAGVVVGVVAVVALVAVVLVTAGGDSDPPLAVAPTPTQTSTPVPTATPDRTSTPAPTPTAQPTPTPSPAPSRTAMAVPLPTASDLGIREVDTADALAAAGLTHVRYEAGEEVPWDPGLFLLDIASGAVEGWVRSLAGLPAEERTPGLHAGDYKLDISPGNRFVSWGDPSLLHDRQTGRTYTWDRSKIDLDRWWGSGAEERLLFWIASSATFVVVDPAMQAVAQFTLPPGERFTSPAGGYILVRGCVECEPGDRFHVVDLEDPSRPSMHTWTLPWRTVLDGDIPYRIELLDDLVAFIAETGEATCRVVRYDLGGTLLSDRTIPSWCVDPSGAAGYHQPIRTLHRISPDGRLLAAATAIGMPVASIFDMATGEEIARITGVFLPWHEREPTNVWLADSSGIVVGAHGGNLIVTLDGTWGDAPGRPAPDDPDRFVTYTYTVYPAPQAGATGQGRPTPAPAVVKNQGGQVQAALSFGQASAPIPEWPDTGFVLDGYADWGTASTTLRVRTSFLYSQEPAAFYEPPPLAPVIEQPPFDDRLLVEVIVDTCLNLREEWRPNSAILTCLPSGAIVEALYQEYYDNRMHIRTDDGVEGWADADYLRWHSDGVRLEE